MELKIGVLAFHGAFIEHVRSLKEAFKLVPSNNDYTLDAVLVKRANQIQSLHGLIIPGGESTVMSKFLSQHGFIDILKDWMNDSPVGQSKPIVWGTCAGQILLANKVRQQKEGGQLLIKGVDITTNRGIVMRQNGCFEGAVTLVNNNLRRGAKSESRDFPGVFINPPSIDSIDADNVEIIAEYTDADTTRPVAVQQNNLIVSNFHPELTDDYRWHEYFIRLIMDNMKK